jgi:predicted ribosome quality control (RQC) complex YloA/Tae2 family protein
MLALHGRTLAGRPLFRLTIGAEWIRLHLEGEDRPALWLTWLAGANLVFFSEGTIPSPLIRGLGPRARNHPLLDHLQDTRLVALGMPGEDRVAGVLLEDTQGRRLHLLHQLFGSRGNTALLAEDGRVLWARHRPCGPALDHPFPDEVWTDQPDGPTGDTVSLPARDRLVERLCRLTLDRHLTGLGRALRSADRLVGNLERDLERAERGDHFRRCGEALAANLHLVKQGQERLSTNDLRDGSPLEIPLDPALPPAANLEALFRRARKAEKGRQIIADRLDEARQSRTDQQAIKDELDTVAGPACADLDCLQEILDWQERHAAALPTAESSTGRTRTHGPEEPARPFRRFLIDGRFELWVGRNNKENDELTHRASHTRDIWLHAQGVSGSHAILRTAAKPENVPHSVIAKAAAVAAANSKARHSGLVPVIYTERRYVRKPRKAPPGTAVCLQEKSLFVEPGIPSGVEPI